MYLKIIQIYNFTPPSMSPHPISLYLFPIFLQKATFSPIVVHIGFDN